MKHQITPVKVLLAVLALFAIVLTACGSGSAGGGAPSEAPALVPTQAGGAAPEPQPISGNLLLDPANATDADSLFIVGYVYEGLFKVDGGAIVPVLAESYTVANDGLDYIIVLRKNVTFHDGSPLNADAVIANFDRWFKKDGSGEYAAWASNFGGFQGQKGADGKPTSTVDGFEKVDEYTVLVHLNMADTLFVAKMVNPAFSIVSPTALGAGNFGQMQGKAAGTGRYQVSAWTATGLSLAPYAGYWGAPATGNLEFQFK
jgi:peptide/nickel transport system substrate-binding protein